MHCYMRQLAGPPPPPPLLLPPPPLPLLCIYAAASPPGKPTDSTASSTGCVGDINAEHAEDRNHSTLRQPAKKHMEICEKAARQRIAGCRCG
jgi:hypothetical protein